MRWFRLNSFTVIGLALLAIGVYGLIKGAGFQFDSGLPAEPGESWFYLLVGALMVVNGCVQPHVPVADELPAPTGVRREAAASRVPADL